MSVTRTSSRRQRILPARYQDDSLTPLTTITSSQTSTSSSSSTVTTPPHSVSASTAPRGRKRSRSPPLPRSSAKKSPPLKSAIASLPPTDFTLSKPPSSTSPPPRLTVPLDIDTTHVQNPAWIDLNSDYWSIWRHVYDKWNIQLKFASIVNVLYGFQEGVEVAGQQVNRLLYVREKLLMDHPERQDLNLKHVQTVKRVWRYLVKVQERMGGGDVAKFNCVRVEKEMKWDTSRKNGDDEEQEDEEQRTMWEQIGNFLVEQGNEGRIFIDPRDYYNHYSWCVEDSLNNGKDLTDTQLMEFYGKFAAPVIGDEAPSREEQQKQHKEIIDCEKCPNANGSEVCRCEETCLLCLPHTEAYNPISSDSALPSPPRTPGTQPLPSYFKGRRLTHPPPKIRKRFTDEEAVEILMGFSQGAPSMRRHKRPRIQ